MKKWRISLLLLIGIIQQASDRFPTIERQQEQLNDGTLPPIPGLTQQEVAQAYQAFHKAFRERVEQYRRWQNEQLKVQEKKS